MARQPFFTGNYGSALAQVDTRPIMQGAAAQAAAYQGLGQTFAGEIEKYQLNKEKNLELDGQIEGTLAGLKDEDSFDFEIELQNNSVMRKLFEKQSKGETGQAEKAKLAGYLSSRSKQQDLQRLRVGQDIATQLKQQNFGLNKQLEAGIIKNQKLTNDQRRIAQTISEIELNNLPDKTRLIIEGMKVNLENEITSGKGLRQDLEYTTDVRSALPGSVVGEAKSDELKVNLALKNLELEDAPGRLRDEAAQRVIEKEKGYQDIEKSAAEYAKAASAEEAYSSAEQAKDLKEKAAATAKETEARTSKLIAELGALQEANKPIDDSMLVGVEDALLPIDIETAAGGDAVGWVTDTANWVAGILPVGGGTGISPDRIRERTNLVNLQGMVVPVFLKAVSTHGGKWAREDVMAMIPAFNDTNANMRSKINRLIPNMRNKLVEAHYIYKKGTSNAAARNLAIKTIVQFPGIIKILRQSVGDGDNVAEAEEFLREGR